MTAGVPVAGPPGHVARGVLTENGTQRFMGLPFALPPVGTRRFAPAVPHPGWAGTRPAVRPGPASLQGKDPMIDLIPAMAPVSVPPTGTSEDCLTLNVWTPDPDGSRPVFVWIYGGGFLTGSNGGLWYDGDRFAAHQDVVYVSVNYRVGLLGLLDARYTGDPDAADCTSIALRDQLAALRWIHDNIAGFGGDPGNVTIAGESAGAASVIALLAMPASAGLVSAAVAQSGHASLFADEDASARRTRTVLDALGISPGPGALAKLRAVPADRFVPLHRRLGLGALPPALDGTWLPEAPFRALAGGRAAGVPLIIGTNTDESRSLRQIIGLPPDPRPFAERVHGSGAGGDLARLNDLYPEGSDDERWDALTADRDWHAPVRELASLRAGAGAATYVYRFDWPTDAVDGSLGSAHMAEIPFALDNLEAAARTGMFAATIADDARAVEQSRLMSSAWGALARSGDPRAAVPRWAPFDGERRGTLVLAGGSAELVPDLDGARIDHWRRRGGATLPDAEADAGMPPGPRSPADR